jgi:hypothetical protein
MKTTLRTMAIATSAFACATFLSAGWSGQHGVSLSINKAEALARVYVRSGYAGGYVDSAGLPWYAVRAYYWGGPWSGPGYSYTGWDDYAARAGITCRPGTVVKGADGIMYLCQ